jgi:hypothetical protein
MLFVVTLEEHRVGYLPFAVSAFFAYHHVDTIRPGSKRSKVPTSTEADVQLRRSPYFRVIP